MIDARELVSVEALRRYDDDGDPVYTPGEQLILALRWFDWATTEQLADALGLESRRFVDRLSGTYGGAIVYWVRLGRIEHRTAFGIDEYRLVHPKQWPAQIDTCKFCRRPRAANRVLCEHHLDLARKYRKRRYQEARTAGVCVGCGAKCTGVRCDDCRDEQCESQKRRNAS